MTIYIDLHVHTWYSGDSKIDPKMLIEGLRAHSFIKGIAITDHDTIEGFYKVKKLAEPYEDITVIPGVEVSTSEGHLMLLGLEEKPRLPISSIEAAEFAHQRGGIVAIPHPYRPLTGIGDLAKHVRAHAVEVFNSRMSGEEASKATALARSMGIAMIAGSDCHVQDQMWKCYTKVKSKLDPVDILRAIKEGKVLPSHRSSSTVLSDIRRFRSESSQ